MGFACVDCVCYPVCYDSGTVCRDFINISDIVKHGQWKYIGGDEWCCSICGNVKTTEGRWEPMMDKFCSECGTKMDGGSDV